jgi:hypothetical protein
MTVWKISAKIAACATARLLRLRRFPFIGFYLKLIVNISSAA